MEWAGTEEGTYGRNCEVNGMDWEGSDETYRGNLEEIGQKV